MIHDVIIVGGSYAGMAAALQLVRAHRTVCVIDGGRPRNRFADHSHGFLTQDGVDPRKIARTARAQLMAYPTLSWIDGQGEDVSGAIDAFVVRTDDGAMHRGRRLLFATGVSDVLPDIAGLAERWGRSVFHCPYCHGYELGNGRIGVIAVQPMSLHQAQLLPEWGEVTFFLDDRIVPDETQSRDLAARGVAIEPVPIARIDGHANVVLADGRMLSFAGLFTAPRCVPASALPERLGCALVETLVGVQLQVDEAKRTSVPGAFACGDVARIPHSVSLAVGDGAWAGAQVHRSLVWPDA